MIHKKTNLLLSLILLITFSTLIYVNNSKRTSFRYLIWNISEIRMGKLISISLVSGLIVSTLLNNAVFANNITSQRKDDEYENYEESQVEEEYSSKTEKPPERDIRDTQPTISVNYRVIKDNRDNEEVEIDSSENQKYQDDWVNSDKDW